MVNVQYGYIGKMVEYIVDACTKLPYSVTPGPDVQGQVFDSQNYNVIVRAYDSSCWNIVP